MNMSRLYEQVLQEILQTQVPRAQGETTPPLDPNQLAVNIMRLFRMAVEANEKSVSDDKTVASIEIVRDKNGRIEKMIKRNAAGETICVVEAEEDAITGIGLR